MLAANMQCLAACHQQPKTAAIGEQIHQGGRSMCDLLKVVKDQQDMSVPQPTLDVFKQRRVRCLVDPDGSGDHGEQRPRVPDRGQVHEEDTVLELVDLFGGGAQCQTRLAGAARPHQSEQPHILITKTGSDVPQFRVPPHERRGLEGKVVGPGVQSDQGWEVAEDVWMYELKYMLRATQ